MRDIFILENMAACKDFISDHIQQGYNEDMFLGVGAFSSSLKNGPDGGVKIKVTPHFLEDELIDCITHGYISVFEQESILIQTPFKNILGGISKWLVLGQHTSIYSIPNAEISKYIKTLNLASIEEFVNMYFTNLILKISEMRSKIALILLDIDMFKNYLVKFFHWAEKERNQTILNNIVNDMSLENIIIKEFLSFLSNVSVNNKIAIVPSNPDYFPVFLNTVHAIKKESNLSSKDILFRL